MQINNLNSNSNFDKIEPNKTGINMNNIARFSYFLAASSISYNLVDQGIANTLALETLRHATNPINNVRIRLTGGSASKSCDPSGSTFGTPMYSYDVSNKKYFFVFKDTEYSTTPYLNAIFKEPIICKLISKIELVFFTKLHAILSSSNMLGIDHEYEKNPLKQAPIPILAACISPTLRFRFSDIDPLRLEDDPNYYGKAYRTEQLVEPWRLGLVGSVLTGLNSDLPSRVEKKPEKFAIGIAQLTMGIYLARTVMKNAPKGAIIPIALGCLLA